ncbi:hypothetical protein [Microbacterium lacus]|uniref:hypothetical protein n=1 Tax=Microbacterium lacus TaxID=415217 RepID=UPI0012FDB43F|nr:hypothetical protein [Microbacterium lacus]
MSDRVCVTNDLDRVPLGERPWPCRRRGVHYAACEDQAECGGCVPRSASVGFLCDVCWAKLTDALDRVGMLTLHLRSIDSNGQALGEKVSRSIDQSMIVPDSWIAADELMDALGAPTIPSTASIDETFLLVDDAIAPWNKNTEEMVNTREGAKRAVVLIRRMQRALRRWPDSEAEWRAIPYVLCPTCLHRNLYRKAPLEYLDEILVVCGTNGCDYQREWFEWSALHAPIFQSIEDDMKRREREERRKARAA